jgi:hypothetical protein
MKSSHGSELRDLCVFVVKFSFPQRLVWVDTTCPEGWQEAGKQSDYC